MSKLSHFLPLASAYPLATLFMASLSSNSVYQWVKSPENHDWSCKADGAPPQPFMGIFGGSCLALLQEGKKKLAPSCIKGQSSKQQKGTSNEARRKKNKKKPAAAQCSRLVTHVNTLWPLRCLSARIGRDAECSSRYGRRCDPTAGAASSTPITLKYHLFCSFLMLHDASLRAAIRGMDVGIIVLLLQLPHCCSSECQATVLGQCTKESKLCILCSLTSAYLFTDGKEDSSL